MFVEEATAEAIRRAYDESGELVGAVEFRRQFRRLPRPIGGVQANSQVSVRCQVGRRAVMADWSRFSSDLGARGPTNRSCRGPTSVCWPGDGRLATMIRARTRAPPGGR